MLMESNLKKRVMLHIYVHFAKDAFLGHKGYFILLVFVVSSFVFVSIGDVLRNLPKDNLSHTFNFLIVAVRDTEWFMQAVLASAAIWLGTVTSKTAFKNLQKFRKHSHLVRI